MKPPTLSIPRPRRLLPGFGLSLGVTLTYLGLLVVIPILAAVLKSFQVSRAELTQILFQPRVLHALYVSLGASLAAAFANAVFGLVLAWVLVRYRFPGRRIFDALVDFPFALPTAVAGLTFGDLFVQNANRTGWLAPFWNPIAHQLTALLNALIAWIPGHPISPFELDYFHGVYSPFSIVLVLIFVGLPFVVRTVQPVLEDLDAEVEEAAASLGASRWQTFYRVILPAIIPAWLTGFALSFARGIGEYGSVVFVSGNRRMKTEIIPVLIVEQLDQYQYAGATVLAMTLLIISFVMLLVINVLTRWSQKHLNAQ